MLTSGAARWASAVSTTTACASVRECHPRVTQTLRPGLKHTDQYKRDAERVERDAVSAVELFPDPGGAGIRILLPKLMHSPLCRAGAAEARWEPGEQQKDDPDH